MYIEGVMTVSVRHVGQQKNVISEFWFMRRQQNQKVPLVFFQMLCASDRLEPPYMTRSYPKDRSIETKLRVLFGFFDAT